MNFRKNITLSAVVFASLTLFNTSGFAADAAKKEQKATVEKAMEGMAAAKGKTKPVSKKTGEQPVGSMSGKEVNQGKREKKEKTP